MGKFDLGSAEIRHKFNSSHERAEVVQHLLR